MTTDEWDNHPNTLSLRAHRDAILAKGEEVRSLAEFARDRDDRGLPIPTTRDEENLTMGYKRGAKDLAERIIAIFDRID